MATEAQINANRKNAENSTGPTSESGKARVALNAVKTGLTGRVMLLSAEDAPIYQKHMDRFFTKYSPANDDEHDLVQTIVDTEWRIRQIAPLEVSILSTGREKCAHLVAHIQDPAQREGALQGAIYLTYEKNLLNISLQERRLNNQLAKATSKLEALQKERKDTRQKELARADKSIKACALVNLLPDMEYFGFDFSIEEFETFSTRSKTFYTLTGGKSMNFDQFLTEFRTQAAASEAQAA
jgi:hypothetical protein